MIDSSEDTIVSAVFDFTLIEEAEKLTTKALDGIEDAAPGWPRVHKMRQCRARRLSRLGDHSIIVALIAQWLSAKQSASAVSNMRETIKRVAGLADEVALLQQQLAQVSSALRYESLSGGAEDVAGSAFVAARSLAEALPVLRFAQEMAEGITKNLPEHTRGRSGIVGAIRDAPPDEALALALARRWILCGLTLKGGNNGDGLDRFLESVLGVVPAQKALRKARKDLSNESSKPE